MPLTWVKNLFHANPTGPRKSSKRPIAVEVLEDRCVPSLTTLYSFTGGNDGSNPYAGLIEDSNGNLFGTTSWGGSSDEGTVFKVATRNSNTLTTLVSFNGVDGINPYAGLIEDSSGNLFGTTVVGGNTGYGTVFKIAAGTNTVTTLVSFNAYDGYDGGDPYASVIEDSSGNLFGTTEAGGAYGGGTVFKIATGNNNTLTTLVSIIGADGTYPLAGLIEDSGNLFGTTSQGGSSNDGTVFKFSTATNTLTTLYSFTGGNDGADPYAGLVEDGNGNLFGTTEAGGAYGGGTVFEIAAGTNTLTTLYSFTGGNDGSNPCAGLIEDGSGNLFGTTLGGGAYGDGTVFKIVAGTNTLTTLVSFNSTDGAGPNAGLIEDSSGNLFGTTVGGGAYGEGTVFEITPVTVTNAVVNQDIPSLYNAAGQQSPGMQRSMVDDIVYTFSEPVAIASPAVDPNVFTISAVTVNGFTGAVPTLSWTAVSGSNDTEWAVSFSGNGVTGGSIANGCYDITITDPASITAVSDGQPLSLNSTGIDSATQSFFRLFGDINGDGVVNAADNSCFKQALTTYNAAFDYNGDGFVNAADNAHFKADLTVNFSGFTPTI